MYQTGTASSLPDLVDKIAIAAGVAGWTIDRNVLVGSLRTATVHKSGDYIHIYNLDAETLYLRASQGYSSGLTPDTETNKSRTRAGINVGNGPFGNYFCFSEDSPSEHVHFVVEITGGVFRFLSFGELVKVGTYTGGTYFDGSYFQKTVTTAASNPLDAVNHAMFSGGSVDNPEIGGVRCDVDGQTNYFAPFRTRSRYAGDPVASGRIAIPESIDSGNADGDGYSAKSGFYDRSINSWSGQTPLQQLQIKVSRPSGFYSLIGDIPNARFLNMARFSAGEEFTIASDTYKVFPWVRQGFVNEQQYSRDYALAFKKVV